MRILIIDNNIDPDCWGAEELRAFARQVPGATVETRRGPQGDLPETLEAYDRIVVSGSKTRISEKAPWVEKELDFIRRALDLNKPYLGVCYGHQMLARAVTGEQAVGIARLGEVGWTKIEVTADSKLFEGLPREFYSYSSHYDEVKEVPRGFRNLAHSQACGVQAMQLGDRPVYGIQFHPEKIRPEPQKTLNASRQKTLYDPKVGERIFGNFFSTA
jgi:GMP synthase (glutamine-hydrolysing)